MNRIILALIAAITIIWMGHVASRAYVNARGGTAITVTGSASQRVSSDLIVWYGSFSRTVGPTGLAGGQAQMSSDRDKIKNLFTGSGLGEAEFTFEPISVNPNYDTETIGNSNSTRNIFTGYTLSQSVRINSKQLDQASAAIIRVGDLLADGVIVSGGSPGYYYTGLPELRVKLQAEAAANAKARAEAIARNSDAKLKGLRSAQSGVIQVTSANSSDVSDEGYYDTTSREKDVTTTIRSSYFVR